MIWTSATRFPARNICARTAPMKWTVTKPYWRGIYDDKGRLVVAISHNMDMGDSWEWADAPRYDEKFSALSFRVAVNYITYSMTH